jgi:hypothetical protein
LNWRCISSQRWIRVIITLFAGFGVTGAAIAAPAQREAAVMMSSLRISVFRTSKSDYVTMANLFCVRFSELLNFVSRM